MNELKKTIKALEKKVEAVKKRHDEVLNSNSVGFKQVVKNQEKAETNEKIAYFQTFDMNEMRSEIEGVKQ